jgi:hypothetical protein
VQPGFFQRCGRQVLKFVVLQVCHWTRSVIFSVTENDADASSSAILHFGFLSLCFGDIALRATQSFEGVCSELVAD